MVDLNIYRTNDENKLKNKAIEDGSAYLAVDEQSQSGDLYIDYDEKRYNVSGNVGYKKITTKGFEIISFEEVNNDTNKSKGYYVLNVTDLSQDIKDKLVGKTITLMNVENVDSYSTIIKVTSELLKLDDTTFDSNNYIHLYVDKIYTNSNYKFYKQSNYTKDGKIDPDKRIGIDKIYPDLGWTIAARTLKEENYLQQACLFINDCPELGTFDWFQDSYVLSAGNGNLAQGKTSFAQGQDNKAYGKYSFASGKQNKAGYTDAVFGRGNDASGAQVSFVAGQENTISDLGFYHAVFGEGNKVSGGAHKLVAGKFNQDKSTNILEIGYGSDDSDRRNVFEIDQNGRPAVNGTYMKGQTLFDTLSMTSEQAKDYLKGEKRIFSSYNGIYEATDSNNQYGPRFRVNLSTDFKDTDNGWYTLVVSFKNIGKSFSPDAIVTWYCLSSPWKEGAGNIQVKLSNTVFETDHYYDCYFPIYIDKNKIASNANGTFTPDSFGFYFQSDSAYQYNIELVENSVKVFKARSITNPILTNYNYDIVSYNLPYFIFKENGENYFYNYNFEDKNVNCFVIEDKKSLYLFPTVAIENGQTKYYPGGIWISDSTERDVLENIKKNATILDDQRIMIDQLTQDTSEQLTRIENLEENEQKIKIQTQSIKQSDTIYYLQGTSGYTKCVILAYDVSDAITYDNLAQAKITVNSKLSNANTYQLNILGTLSSSLTLTDIQVTYLEVK